MTDTIEQYKMTKPAQIIWASVVTPRKANAKLQTKEPRYEAVFLFEPDHPDLTMIQAQTGAVLKAKFGSGKDKKVPLSRGDKLADEAAAKGKDREFLRGKILFRPHANVAKRNGDPLNPPRLVVHLNGKWTRFEGDERPAAAKYFYSGVLALGEFSFVAYDGMGGGVSAYLNEIVSLNAGEKINTGVDDEEKWGAPTEYVGKLSQVNPAAGIDDEVSY